MMRVFTCLSQNVSLALESSQRLVDSKRPKHRLNFKNKKRRNLLAAVTGSSKQSRAPTSANTVVVPQQNALNDENTPPTSIIGNKKKNAIRAPPTKPLPPIPSDVSSSCDDVVFIKELTDDSVTYENDSGYLPLSHIGPALTEEEDNTTMTTSYSPRSPSSSSFPPPPSSGSLILSPNNYTTNTTTVSSTTGGGIPPLSPLDSTASSTTTIPTQHQKFPRANVGTTCSGVSDIRAVGSFNEAFIQSSTSLPRLRNVLSSTRLDTVSHCAPRGSVQTTTASSSVSSSSRKKTTSTTSTSTSTTTDASRYMTYSRRRAQTIRQKRQRLMERQQQQATDYYATLSDSSSSASSRVEEVSDLLEASVAEYDYKKKRLYSSVRRDDRYHRRGGSSRKQVAPPSSPASVRAAVPPHHPVRTPASHPHPHPSCRKTLLKTDTVEVFSLTQDDLQLSQTSNSGISAFTDYNNDTAATTTSQTGCNANNNTALGVETSGTDNYYSAIFPPGPITAARFAPSANTNNNNNINNTVEEVYNGDGSSQSQHLEVSYSQLVDYSRSTLPSCESCEEEGDDEHTLEFSTHVYENDFVTNTWREALSQTGSYISGYVDNNNTGSSSVYTAADSRGDYSQSESQQDVYECASNSQSYCSPSAYFDGSGGQQLELSTESPSYVNIPKRLRPLRPLRPLREVTVSSVDDNNDNNNQYNTTTNDDDNVDDTAPVYVDTDDTAHSHSRASEFLGCMSFGVPHLMNKELEGWYYLLTEEVGRKKHLQARTGTSTSSGTTTTKKVGQTTTTPTPLIPNMMVEGQEKIVISVTRGKTGFGFTFVDELPPKIGRVDKCSPAEQAGIKKDDSVVCINGRNVSRSTCEGVAHLVKQMKTKSLTLELLRDHIVVPHPTSTSTTTSTSTSTSTRHQSTTARRTTTNSQHHLNQQPQLDDDHLYESIAASRGDHYKENRRQDNGNPRWMEDVDTEEDDTSQTEDSLNYTRYSRVGSMPNLKALTSTPMAPTATHYRHQPSPPTSSRDRHESIHRLMSLELDFIDFMHYGAERYSRPLRHCIVSAQQHGAMFQNVEKLVTISEYHIKQMQHTGTTSAASEDTDDSQSSEGTTGMFPTSVALIYQSKIHMLSQAYETYAHGLMHSNSLLRELRSNRDFVKFVKSTTPPQSGGSAQPSISAFINRPVQHIHELYTVFSEIFSGTAPNSADYPVLQKITCKLAQCVTAITSLSSAGRVHSLDSLTTSSQGCSTSQTTSSGKGSMASLTSCSSAETEALRSTRPPAPTIAPMRPIDQEVARLQDRLVFPPHVPTFQLCQEDRHIIFQGDMYRCHHGTWFKSSLLLLSDMLLLLDHEADGHHLRVVDTPFYLADLSGLEVNRKHASEFVLHLHNTTRFNPKQNLSKRPGNTRPLVLRAPSAQEKFMWKSLLEQRVSSVNGTRLAHCGSMRDISNVKTSVVL